MTKSLYQYNSSMWLNPYTITSPCSFPYLSFLLSYCLIVPFSVLYPFLLFLRNLFSLLLWLARMWQSFSSSFLLSVATICLKRPELGTMARLPVCDQGNAWVSETISVNNIWRQEYIRLPFLDLALLGASYTRSVFFIFTFYPSQTFAMCTNVSWYTKLRLASNTLRTYKRFSKLKCKHKELKTSCPRLLPFLRASNLSNNDDKH